MAKKYIDIENLKNQLNSVKAKSIVGAVGIAWLKVLLNKLPAADVVEVVRCKECHYGRELDKDDKNYKEGYCECKLCDNGDCNPCDHYCSYGFKKGE